MPETPAERALSSMSMARGLSPFSALERCLLFEGLDRAALTDIAMVMRPQRFEPGTELCQAGGRGESLFVIADGLVDVLADVGNGETEVIAKQRRGDVVGATSVITGEPHSATVIARAPTETLMLDRAELERLVERFPSMLVNFSRILSRRLLRSYVQATDERERGEAVGLVFGASLAPLIEPLLDSAGAASPRPVASLDTRSGYHDAIVQLDDLLEDNATVVVLARAEGRSAPLLLDHVDRAVVLVETEAEADRFAEASSTIELVLVGERASAAATAPVRVFRRDGQNGAVAPEDVAWLGRHLTRTKLGLALGAGGAKGFAHVGALAVLEEAGYTVDYVAGSSIGAIVGSYLALGMDSAEIERTLRETFNPETVAEIFQISLSGASTGLEAITRIFRDTTGDRSFDEVSLPLVIMSVDLTSRSPAPIREGLLWEALLAATALAGMFPPHEREGHRLVDGLALVPVPTGSVYEDGADIAVSVNLMPRESLPAWPGEPPSPPQEARKRGSRMLDTILEVMDLSQLEDSVRHADLADVVVNPRFGPSSWRDFHLADLFLAAGREAAQDQLPALEALAKPQFARNPN
jgi:NTE family protein